MEFLNFIHKYSYSLTRVRFVSAFVFLLLSAEVASAGCQIGGAQYRETGDAGGTYITLTNIIAWADNGSDDVTTCDVSTLTSLRKAFFNKSTFNQDIVVGIPAQSQIWVICSMARLHLMALLAAGIPAQSQT